jgi:hypothetical protein
MQMCVEIEMSTESVLDHHNQGSDLVHLLHPLLYDFSGKRRQIVQEKPVLLKNGPKNLGHGQNNACIRDIRELGPLVTLP